MPNQFFSPEGDLEDYFVSEYWLIDQYIGDQLWTWGSNGSLTLGNATDQATVSATPITTSAGGSDWKQVSCGAETTGAIKTDGTLWLWGSGSQRCLGNGQTTDKSTPITTFAGGTNWKQVSCGRQKTAAIKTDGTLWTWGYAGKGQLGSDIVSTFVSTPITTFAGGTDWRQVEVGYYHTAAIKTDGSLWTWGDYFSDFGSLGRDTYFVWFPKTIFSGAANTPTTNPEDLYTLSAGYSATASIKTDGTLWIWGYNGTGGLGTNNQIDRSTPVTTFTGGTNWKQVSFSKGSFGNYISSAIKTDGTLWVWGTRGLLGIDAVAALISTPITTFAGGNNWADTPTTNPEDLYTLSAGSGGPNAHSAAIKTDGTLWVWGPGGSGRLGNAVTTNISFPVTTFSGGTNWKQVSTGFLHTAAIKTDGTLWTWGSGNSGRLGNAQELTVYSTPVTTFAGGTNWKQVSAGSLHTSAIKTDGTLWVWGFNGYGQLGIDIASQSRSTPVTTFAGGTNWKQVSCGYRHVAAIKTDGTLWVWGNQQYGRLGNAVIGPGNAITPITTFSGGTDWRQVSYARSHTVAIKTDGTLWTWGFGGNGRLGNAVTTNTSTPVTTFAGGTNWKQVSGGSFHMAAIKTDGTLWTWGNGGNGQLGDTSVTTIISTPITTFAGGTNWKQVSCGYNHTIALTDDGVNKLLFVWGNGRVTGNDINNNIPNSLSGTNWKQVSSGGQHTAAIKTDGTLWAWGSGSTGRLGNAVTTNASTPITTFAGGTNWKQVSSGFSFITAIKTDGTLWTWGNGNYGQLGTLLENNLRFTPVTTFAGGTNWADTATAEPEDLYTLSAGNVHTAAIKTDGTLWTWGLGTSGQLGNRAITNISTPITTFAGGTNWKQVSSGNAHTAAIKTDGTLWTWGAGSTGRLGNGVTTGNISTPITTFAGGTNWKQVSSGSVHTAAIKTDGTLWSWGYGFYGRLGNGITTGNRSTPVTTFAGGTNWKQVSAGASYTTAIKTDGTLWTWGNSNRLGIILTGTLVDGGVSGICNTTAQLTGTSGFSPSPNTGTRITTSSGTGTVTSITNSLLGAASLTASTTPTGNNDDGYWTLTLPFNISYNATSYGTIYVGTNSYVTFNAGYTVYSGLSFSNPDDQKIMISAGDRSGQRIYYGTEGTAPNRTYRVIFEGSTGTSGTLGSPTMLWEMVFYENATNQIDIQVGINNVFSTLTPQFISTPVTTFAGGTNWKQVSAAYDHAAAIKTDGTLWTWGLGSTGRLGNAVTTNTSTPVTTFAGGTNWKQVSGGSLHMAAIKTDGTLWTWGNGSSGRLGNLTDTFRSTPVTTFAGGTNWKQVSTGFLHTVALRDDGVNKQLFVFGSNINQQLGINVQAFTFVSTPVTTFTGGTNWKQVDSGENSGHVLAVKTDGTLWTWGISNRGCLGNGSVTSNAFTPITTFAGGTNWKQASAGRNHSLAVKTDGTFWVWGEANDAQLGIGGPIANFASSDISTPITTFAGGTNWMQVSAGWAHSAALRSSGVTFEAVTFGYSNRGAIGNGINLQTNYNPGEVFGNFKNWKQVSCGYHTTAAVKTDGTLWAWGYNDYGQLGNAISINSNTPTTTFAGGNNWKQVSSNGYFSGHGVTAAIKTDGTLWIWGRSRLSMLGNRTNGNVFEGISTPVTTFAGGTNWKQVDVGSQMVSATKIDGTLWTWGDNDNGQLGVNDFIERNTPVTTFAGGTNWKQVSCGGYHIATVQSGINADYPLS
jgi:alpha-tubulin suppressor-like RCC1 family protein